MEILNGSWIVVGLLLSVRIGAMAFATPMLGGSIIPASIRVAIVLSWSAVLAASVVESMPTTLEIRSVGPLLAAVASEAALGAAMGLGLALAFASFAIGARIVDIQIGYGMGQVFDPSTRQQIPVLQALVTQAALVGFFLFDGHHGLVRGLALSLEAVPLGSAWTTDAALPGVSKLAAQMFSLGFAMVAPIVLCLMAVELGLGVVSRNLPQMNTLVVGMPIKVIVGLLALALWAAGAAQQMNRAYLAAFEMWEGLWQ